VLIDSNLCQRVFWPQLIQISTHGYLQRLSAYNIDRRDGEEGPEAGGEVPDIIICDVHLPTIDGYEVALAQKPSAAPSDSALVAVMVAMAGDRSRYWRQALTVALPNLSPETLYK
jgi:CheY-like chemotaxis protein